MNTKRQKDSNKYFNDSAKDMKKLFSKGINKFQDVILSNFLESLDYSMFNKNEHKDNDLTRSKYLEFYKNNKNV